ncbi:MAG: hypothetical protein JXD19_10045 [Deltaproteobacteria bacterium]|nr:hypothetical protein [Deltaproteobacteria bacterium]
MNLEREISFPYFNPTEKKIVYAATEEAASYLRRFYCFSPREWFNYCFDIKTACEADISSRANRKAFAEIGRYDPVLKDVSAFPKERYQIFLFDRNILNALWRCPDVEFYPLMIYILTHELIHIARFCQNLHPFDCDDADLQKEEEKVSDLTQKVLDATKNEMFAKIGKLYQTGPVTISCSPTGLL